MNFVFSQIAAAMAIAVSLAASGLPPNSPVAAPAEMRYCGMKPGRPPLKYLSFDIKLHNSAGKSQWFLFPASVYDKPAGEREGAGIDTIELFADPQGQVTVVHFMGTMHLQPDGAGGFKGVLLPPGATVSIQNFGISFWGEPASPLAMKIVLADQITMAGTPVEQWIGKSLLSAKTADIKELQRAGSKSTEDSKEVRVEITKSGEVTIPDVLAQRCSTQPAQ